MGETTAISWADATVSFWAGCQKVSPACDGCYAENLMDTRFGRVEWGGPGNGAGTRTRTAPANWHGLPQKLERRAIKEGTRPFIFANSLSDTFDNAVPPEWRREMFDVIRATPHLVWLLLTKRPQNIVKMAAEAGGMPANAAIGTTVEDQERAINLFRLAVAARATRPLFTFASFEPLLGPIDPTRIVISQSAAEFFSHPEIDTARFLFDALRGAPSINLPALGWAITGGETDQGTHKARPTHPDWFRSLRDQSAAAGVPFHHKQNGEWIEADGPRCRSIHPTAAASASAVWMHQDGRIEPRERRLTPYHTSIMAKVGKARAGRLLDRVLHDTRPEVRS